MRLLAGPVTRTPSRPGRRTRQRGYKPVRGGRIREGRPRATHGRIATNFRNPAADVRSGNAALHAAAAPPPNRTGSSRRQTMPRPALPRLRTTSPLGRKCRVLATGEGIRQVAGRRRRGVWSGSCRADAHMGPRAKRSRRLPPARRERVAATGGRVRGAEGRPGRRGLWRGYEPAARRPARRRERFAPPAPSRELAWGPGARVGPAARRTSDSAAGAATPSPRSRSRGASRLAQRLRATWSRREGPGRSRATTLRSAFVSAPLSCDDDGARRGASPAGCGQPGPRLRRTGAYVAAAGGLHAPARLDVSPRLLS